MDYLIEDCCDAFRVTVNAGWRIEGVHGRIGNLKFYPAHHITMGEGAHLDQMKLLEYVKVL